MSRAKLSFESFARDRASIAAVRYRLGINALFSVSGETLPRRSLVSLIREYTL